MTMRTLAAIAAAVVFAALPAFAATPATRTAGKPAEIPFTLEGGNIVVDVELKPGQHLPFVFDSGLSNGNLIATAAAKALDLKPDSQLDIGDAGGARESAALTTIPRILVGAARLSDQLFAIIAMPDAVTHRQGKPPIAGFLGAPLLQDAVLCIDYTHRNMRRWARSDFDGAGRSSVPMTLTHELPTIAVDIDGRKARLIVDSGNDGAVVVFPSFADQNDFRTRYPHLAAREANGGSGQTFETLTGEAASVRIGPDTEFRHVPLAVIPQGMDPAWGIDGMVGFGVLSRLNPCLDREGQRLLFRGE